MAVPSHKPLPSQDPVNEIGAFLAADLRTIEDLLHDVLQSDSPLIREVGEYICLTSGKKLRPMMTLLASRAFGPLQAESPVKIAAGMEAIHVATLLHDDVIDKASLRRGKPSVNARWGDDVAILMADYLFAAAFDLALYQLPPEPLRLLTQVTRRMCEGEMLQIEQRGRWLTCDSYLEIIRSKTAHLFSACCALGGFYAGLDGDAIDHLSNFGLNFGMAFQITDDTLDYVAADNHWGKATGIDLAAGKQTLPMLLALQDATPEDRRRIEAIMSNGRDLGMIEDLFARYNTIERSLVVARQYAIQAAARLEQLAPADEVAYDHLVTLTDYVVSRRF